jgi:hypothetical protein
MDHARFEPRTGWASIPSLGRERKRVGANLVRRRRGRCDVGRERQANQSSSRGSITVRLARLLHWCEVARKKLDPPIQTRRPVKPTRQAADLSGPHDGPSPGFPSGATPALRACRRCPPTATAASEGPEVIRQCHRPWEGETAIYFGTVTTGLAGRRYIFALALTRSDRMRRLSGAAPGHSYRGIRCRWAHPSFHSPWPNFSLRKLP